GLPGSFRTVAEALQKAQAGDRIVLLDTEHRELLRIHGDRNRGVRIEAAEGVAGTWLPTPGRPDDGTPLIYRAGARDVVLKGIRFNGENRLQRLIYMTGLSPGLTLENISLTGFKKNGLALMNCAGEPDRPVQLLRVNGTSKEKAEAAVVFYAAADTTP